MMALDTVSGYFTRDGRSYCIIDSDREFKECTDDIIGTLDYSESFRRIYSHPVSGENVFKFNYGPSTGGMIETLDLKIYTYGERILSLDVLPGYKQRQIRITGESKDLALLRIERLNGFHSFSYSTLFSSAVERMLEIPVSQEVRYARIILLEIERITSHIFKTARLCESASQNIASYALMGLRERLMRAIAEGTGHRYLFGVNKIGGIRRKIDLDRIVKVARGVVNEYVNIRNGLFVSRIFIDRIENTCRAEYSFARGPVLRAAGIRYDFRMHDPYYSGIDFTPVTQNGGDSLSRFLVFSEEVERSMEIIEKCMTPGERGDFLIPSHENEAYGIETPSGDARMVFSINNDHIGHIYLRTPSILNLEAFARGIRGNVKTDIPFALESFGIWVSELGDVA